MDVKTLTRENAILKEVLDHVDTAVQIIDRRGINRYYNNAAAEMDNIRPEEVLGRHILEVYPSLNPSTSSLLKVMETREPIINKQQTLINQSGRAVTTLYSSYPLFYRGQVVGACDISRDITKIKELSEKVLDLQAALLDRKAPGEPDAAPGGRAGAIFTLNDIIGQDPKMVHLKVLAQRVAQSTSPVLVYGETGTGKELLVQAIHSAGVSRQGPFVAQNCAALPAALLESIFFGTVKGSFTGAGDRQGLFELAHGGTLFFDEINSLPIELQGKLLRALQERAVRRVGDHRLRKVDVRIIASTNTDPADALEQKTLRQDLYYRLNVVSVGIPPLRERLRDIPLLISHFIQHYNKKLSLKVMGVSDGVEKIFCRYGWPGNVRELQHCIEHAMNIMEGQLIEVEHLPVHISGPRGPGSPEKRTFSLKGGLAGAVNKLEKEIISEALNKSRGNVSRAAKELQVPRQTLQYKIKNYGLQISPEDKK